MTHRTFALACSTLLILACQGGQPAPTGQPAAAAEPAPAGKPAPPKGRPHKIILNFQLDGPSAVPEPADEDKGWRNPSYDELAPSRPDGKPTYSNDWFRNNPANWARHLSHLKGKENLRYLEVGVFEGQSLIWAFENLLTHPGSTAVGIDLFDFEGLEERFQENIQRAGIAERVETIKAYSNVGLRPLKANSFDLIYIDASHTGANVLRDGILCWDLLKEGGILIFDDYGLRSRYPAAIRPGPVIDTFITAFYKELEVLDVGWQTIVRRKPTGCWDNCSELGPYYYYWDYKNPQSVGTGTLFDPRTDARVPLSQQEHTIIERWLLARPMGSPFPTEPAEVWNQPETQALAKKLNLI